MPHYFVPMETHLTFQAGSIKRETGGKPCGLKGLGRKADGGGNASWLRSWIPNPGIPSSKPLVGSKFDSAFHPSEVNQTSTRVSGIPNDLMVKSKMPPCGGSVALRHLNPSIKGGHKPFKS